MISLSLTERQCSALLTRLLQPESHSLSDLDRPRHYSDVEEVRRQLATELEKTFSKSAPPSNVPGSLDGQRKRGRPPKEKPAASSKAACKDGEHKFEVGRCVKCGEPEPRTCANGYHLNESGKCSRCGKVEESGAAK